jgi:hypothetical protein
MQQSRLGYKLLFEEEAPDGHSLFAGLGELADALAAVRGTDRTRGLAAFLAQILREGQRSCPEAMISELQQVVRERLKGKDEAIGEDWTRRLRRALEADNLSRGGGRPLSAEALYGELLYIAETAEEHYIITAVPAERVISEQAEELREVLLRRLGVLDPDPPETLTTRYTFHLPTKADCIHWWDSLISEVRSAQRGKGFDIERTRQYLTKLDKADTLRLFSLDDQSSLCGCPLVVFDPSTSALNGFNLYYYSDPTKAEYSVSVAKMDSGYLEQWKLLVYSPLENERIKRTRVRLSDVLSAPTGV